MYEPRKSLMNQLDTRPNGSVTSRVTPDYIYEWNSTYLVGINSELKYDELTRKPTGTQLPLIIENNVQAYNGICDVKNEYAASCSHQRNTCMSREDIPPFWNIFIHILKFISNPDVQLVYSPITLNCDFEYDSDKWSFALFFMARQKSCLSSKVLNLCANRHHLLLVILLIGQIELN